MLSVVRRSGSDVVRSAGLFFFTMAAAGVLAAPQGPPPEILTSLPASQGKALDASPEEPSMVRRRAVGINPQVLGALKSKGNGKIRFNLFEDLAIDAVFNRVVSQKSPDRYVLEGHVDGNPLASVVLAANQEATVADIRMPGGDTYQIRYRGNGIHEAQHIVESELPPCGVDHEHDLHLPAGTSSNVTASDSASGIAQDSTTLTPGIAADTGTMIDVMVVYTTQAKNQQGGLSGMQALIDLAITYANNTYRNSGINTSLRLVHSAEVSYTESGSMSTDLSRLTGKSDGHMDNIHALRDTYKADMVSLLVSTTTGGTCGIAYVMGSLSNWFESSCFSVVANGCVSNQSFTHELGHNMGCAHARGDGGSGLYSYSYGHRWTGSSGKTYRSVMAYAPGTRIQYFSNPNVSYDGVPTGSPLGTSTEAYNALSINNTAYTVANFRTGAAPATPALSATPGSLTANITQGQNAASQTVQVGNSAGGTLSYTLSDNAAWLSVSPSSGTSTGVFNSHTVSFNTSALASGTHNASITVTASGAANSPITIPVTLSVQAPAPPAPVNDPFSGAISLSGTVGSVTASSVNCVANQTGEPSTIDGQPFGKSLWWKWTAPKSGTLTFDTFGSTFDTVLGVYRGSLGSLVSVGENDQAAGGNQSKVGPISVTEGTTYYILVGGWYGESGTANLNWSGTLVPVVMSGFTIE